MWLKIPIDLETEAARTHLLQELDRWIKLGMLSEGQTLKLGQKLSSPLPIAYKVPSTAAEPSQINIVNPPELVVETPASPKPPIFYRFKSHLVQSFLAEVSVLWLLFLGVFLVVVSSGVLAASQWQSLSPVVQYSILLVYTLAFGGASRWAARQTTLQTTAQMLKAATLLLIPLNLWMMDALGLIKTSAGVAGLASVGLSALTLLLAPQRRFGLNLLGLSWLHWGWGITSWPLIATYLGTAGSAINLVQITHDNGEHPEETHQSAPESGGILVAIALLILLVRSVWVAQIPVTQLGLALGICGWMLCRLWQYPLWPQVGLGLMLIGWLVTAGQQPLQAIGISSLASWLLVEQLQQSTQERHQLRILATLWLAGFQTCGLMWLTLPIEFRQTLLATVGGSEPVSVLNFAGVWLYGYVGLMILGVRQFQRREQASWARLTQKLALGISGLLVLCALPQSFLCTLSLLGLTFTFAAITRLQPSAKNWLIYGTHSSAIITILSGIYAHWANPQWAIVLISLTTVEWLASVASTRYPKWRQSAWYLGLVLSAIAYGQLLDNWHSWLNLVWLVVPGVLTWLVYRPSFATNRPQVATMLAATALGGQFLLVSSWPMATVVFAVGAGLLFLHSGRWPTQKFLPVLTLGFAVGGIHTAVIWLWSMSKPWPDLMAHLFLVTALSASALSLLARCLDYQSQQLLQAYGPASRGWSRGLAISLSLTLTLIMVLIYTLSLDSIQWIVGVQSTELILRYGIAATILLLARCLTERRLTNLNYWELAHYCGLLMTMGLTLWHGATSAPMATAMTTLAVLTQLAGTIYVSKNQRPYKSSWHYIPLAYGALGLVFAHWSFTPTTGIYALVIGLVTLSIGRRQPRLHPLGYGGLGLVSLGIYELVIYRMLQATGGELGDGLTLLALVGGAIATIYLLCHSWIQRYSRLTVTAIGIASLLHWLLAVILAAMAMVSGQSRAGIWLWLGVTTLLTFYAGFRGNSRWFPATESEESKLFSDTSYQQWTWSGLVIATIAIPYGAVQLLPNLAFIRGWGALLACGLGLLVHTLPWQRWGWPVRPWQRIALSWPILAVFLSVTAIKTQGLLLVGAFYAGMAQRLRTVRLSYLSLGLFNWALLRYLIAQGWLNLLWAGLILGLSALYILEVDPHWQTVSARQARHRLRSFATLLIGLTAIFQAETALPVVMGLSLLISFGFIGFGLVTRVRAYLYTGTLTFALQVLRAISLFVSSDGRMLWAIGIILGITLIWIAATFEARRAQISQLLNRWSDLLQTWE